MTWRDPLTRKWESNVQKVQGSPQVVELAAVVRTFEKFKEPLNLASDSAYVGGVVSRAEHAMLKEVKNPLYLSVALETDTVNFPPRAILFHNACKIAYQPPWLHCRRQQDGRPTGITDPEGKFAKFVSAS